MIATFRWGAALFVHTGVAKPWDEADAGAFMVRVEQIVLSERRAAEAARKPVLELMLDEPEAS